MELNIEDSRDEDLDSDCDGDQESSQGAQDQKKIACMYFMFDRSVIP